MDEICIQKVLNGNPEEFRHLITKYKDMAYSIAMSVIKDEFLAEEIIQISFIKAFDKLHTFKGVSKFSTWFYRIVINEAFKHANKSKNEFVNFVETLPAKSPDIDNVMFKLESDDQKHFINEALKKLNSKEGLALRLFYLEENSIKEISDMTGWTDSNIKVILHRARFNLKHVLMEIYKLDRKGFY